MARSGLSCSTQAYHPSPLLCAGRTLSAGMIVGTVVSALVLIALGIAGIVLYRRHRRRRPKYVFDEPDAAAENKKGASGTNGNTSSAYGTTSSSAISTELRKAALHIDHKDIIIEQNERGNVMLGKGAYGEVCRTASHSFSPLGSHH